MSSEIAMLRERIAAECEALKNLSSFSSTASHKIIHEKYRSLDRFHHELKAIIGEEQAIETIVTIYNQHVR